MRKDKTKFAASQRSIGLCINLPKTTLILSICMLNGPIWLQLPDHLQMLCTQIYLDQLYQKKPNQIHTNILKVF